MQVAVDHPRDYKRILMHINILEGRIFRLDIGIFAYIYESAVLNHGQPVVIEVVTLRLVAQERIVGKRQHHTANAFQRASGRIYGHVVYCHNIKVQYIFKNKILLRKVDLPSDKIKTKSIFLQKIHDNHVRGSSFGDLKLIKVHRISKDFQ